MKTTRKLLYTGLLLPLLSGMQLDANHTTDLHQALQNQDITAALDYIKNSNQEELNQCNKEQASPLHVAAQKECNFAKFTGKQQVALKKTVLPLTKNQLHLQNGLLQTIESNDSYSDVFLITKKYSENKEIS